MFDNLASSLTQVKAGKIKALAVTTSKRSNFAPELPTIADVHHHSIAMQKHFLDDLARIGPGPLDARHLVPTSGVKRGNFLTFDVDGAEHLQKRLIEQQVLIDRRDRRLRFGFGVYHSEHDVRLLLEALSRALK